MVKRNFTDINNHFNLILASNSPRRQFLLKDLGLNFTLKTKPTEEDFPPDFKAEKIPLYLAEKKATAFVNELKPNDLIITADTIVWINNMVLNKPADADEAKKMLMLLSGKMHQVFTGVCLLSANKKEIFYAETKVHFKLLTDEEINYYIANFKPYDKAGAYGAQEWIGYIAVEKIEGSYFNVMGLPLRELYTALCSF
jgi:septum formation protein